MTAIRGGYTAPSGDEPQAPTTGSGVTQRYEPPTREAAADAALAYALWDAENTIRMRGDCIGEHLDRARAVRHWLRVHGHDVVAG